MRVAIVSTPRCGNTWVRSVLARSLDLQQIAVHNPRDIPAELPQRVALQIHWYREPGFQEYLRANNFQVVVIARHPLDILLSVLHFAPREPLTQRWLEGNGELPDFAGCSPVSPQFLRYAMGWGAENLLSVSYQWWHEPSAIRVRYEDLVADPHRRFGVAVASLGEPVAPVSEALEANPFQRLRDTPNRHAWQGTPGLWRQLILPWDAWRIFHRHRRVFHTLGYAFRPYLLTRRTARSNWVRLS